MSTLRLAGLVSLASLLLASTAEARTTYPRGALHSPMTESVVTRLRAVLSASQGQRDTFVKIGDSNTASTNFMSCLAAKEPRMGAHLELDETRRFFGVRAIEAGQSSFNRRSLAATVGWLTGQVLAGAPSFLDREIAAAKPAFAVVMLGTNDNRPAGMPIFTRNLTEVVDRTLAAGVIPLLSTLPPRGDSALAEARVVEMNTVIRALAESREVPLMDLHAALATLPQQGLVRDGIHLSTIWENGAPRPCRFTEDGLQKGMNTRNLLVLQALDRARRFVLEQRTPDAEPQPGA
ncbi:MAG: SGNH/GDSL hydrolase family protein [Byssovorax sp.]